MNFELDKPHQLMRQMYRDFAETEIAPIAKDMDEAEAYDMELLKKLMRYGIFGIAYPKQYGGEGADILGYVLAMEEMSRIDGSTGITIEVHSSLCCQAIYHYGTEEQKQTFLRPLVDGSKIGCFGLTEPATPPQLEPVSG